jgi:hypothetical protein
MLFVVRKYEMFGESEKAKRETTKFKNNFEVLQVLLGEIESKLFDTKSHLPEIEKEVKEINERMAKLFQKYNFGHRIDSVILEGNHWRILGEWFNNNKAFTLLYRASKDGYEANTFHNKCDNKGPTVTIIKCTNGYIFGGYNPSSWNKSGDYSNSNGAFLFTLKNPHSIPPTKYFCSDRPYSACSQSQYGPTFGGGCDIYISDKCNENNNSYCGFPYSYRDTTGYGRNTFTGGYNFQVADYEVFSVSQ